MHDDAHLRPARQIRGVELDAQTRCSHYHGVTDIVAIQMKCCGVYYGCRECHDALADHAAQVWPPDEWDSEAVRCGACAAELTIRAYLGAGARCPACQAAFNPRCEHHYHLYFDWAPDRERERPQS